MEKKIRINSIFETVQGEGKHAGRAALFIRMPFCNLKCSWCDTEFDSYTEWTEHEAYRQFRSAPMRFAVLTGGEPMLNKDSPFVVKILKDLGFEIAVETNGTAPIISDVDFVTVSPKREQRNAAPYFVCEDALARAHEFKYVVDKDFDFTILSRHDTRDGRRYSLSPEFGEMDRSVHRIMEYQKVNSDWLMSLQTHKWIGVA